MKSFILVILVLIPICNVFGQNKTEVSSQESSAQNSKNTITGKLTYSIFTVSNAQFGYDILQNNKLLIHQPQIPGISGNAGFSSREDAAKVAVLVIDKIKNGIFPPTVAPEELRNLKVKVK